MEQVQDQEMIESEAPPPIEGPASKPTETKPKGPPDLNRWEVWGGFEKYLSRVPGAFSGQASVGYYRILEKHIDVGGNVGVGLGSAGCCSSSTYFDLPITVSGRFYPLVANDVSGSVDEKTGSKVRHMSDTGNAPAPYLFVDTGVEIANVSTQTISSTAVGWIVGAGAGLDFNLDNSSSVFGQLRFEFTPLHTTFANIGRGNLNALMLAGGYRF
jgi:hypothetical protein